MDRIEPDLSYMAKRRYGKGGLYKRGRVWWIKYYVDRYPMFESARTEDKKQAEDLLRQRLAEAKLNQLPDPASRRVTIEEILALLLSDYRFRNRASIKQLESRVNRHLIPLLGTVRAAEFGHKHVEAYVRQRRQKNASDTSINRELEHLRAAFRLAVEQEVLPKAPKIRMLEEENVRTGFLEHWDYEALRSKLPPDIVPLFVTGYHVGCRLGELLKLKWEQVDFNASQIWLDKKETKGKVARVLPIYGDMVAVLEAAKPERDAKWPDCRYCLSCEGKKIVDSAKHGRRHVWQPAFPGCDFTIHAAVPSGTWIAPAFQEPQSGASSAMKLTPCSNAITSSTSATFTTQSRRRSSTSASRTSVDPTLRLPATTIRMSPKASPNWTKLPGELRGNEGNCNQFCDQIEGNGEE